MLQKYYICEKHDDKLVYQDFPVFALIDSRKSEKITQLATFIGLGLLGVLALILFLFFRSKQRSNKLLSEKSQKLEKANQEIQSTNEELQIAHQEVQMANEELQTANEEVQAMNDTLTITLDTIEEQRNNIMSSIQYAQRIQASILPRKEYFQTLLPEHFVLFRPRDVVSGDFY